MKKRLVAIVVLLGFFGTSYAFAGHGLGKRAWGAPVKALLQLDLTDAQKHQVAVILKGSRSEVQAKADALRQARQQLRDAINQNAFDEAAVRKAYQAVAAGGESLVLVKARVIGEIRKILTPEQLTKLDQLRAARSEKMKERGEQIEQKRTLLDEWIDVYSQAG